MLAKSQGKSTTDIESQITAKQAQINTLQSQINILQSQIDSTYSSINSLTEVNAFSSNRFLNSSFRKLEYM